MQGLHPCLYYNVPTGLAFRLLVMFVLLHKTFWADGWWWMDGLEGDAPMEFYKEWAFFYRGSATLHPCLYYNVPTGLAFGLTFYAGTPFYFVPACILSSRWDLRSEGDKKKTRGSSSFFYGVIIRFGFYSAFGSST